MKEEKIATKYRETVLYFSLFFLAAVLFTMVEIFFYNVLYYKISLLQVVIYDFTSI